MWARQMMTTTIRTVAAHDSIADAARAMRDADVGMLPVVDDPRAMHLIGIITDRDIATRCVAENHAPGCTVREHMTTGDLAVVSPYATEDEVLATMERHLVRRVPVLEEGKLVGVIAQADVAASIGPVEPAKVEHLLEQVSTHTMNA